MNLAVRQCSLSDILPLRNLFLTEAGCQIRYDACHSRGWSDSYLLFWRDCVAGYGSVMGQNIENRDTIFEYYILPHYKDKARAIFSALMCESKATYIECQTNVPLLTSMLLEHGRAIRATHILFADQQTTCSSIDGALFRRYRPGDTAITDEMGEFVVVMEKEIVATGGFLTHYNTPYSDVYMEVRSDQRRKGFGGYLVQELKRASYEANYVPAARCPIDHIASRATLLRAGFRVSGYILRGLAHVSSSEQTTNANSR